jgi:hypothetical protein
MLMRLIMAAVLAVAVVPGVFSVSTDAQAAEVDGANAAAIRQIIQDQLAAFQRDDGVEAFSYASPGIQAQFQTPEFFMEMVRQGYQPVYRPRDVEFRELKIEGNVIVQEVHLVGPDGQPVLARYTMERQPDGSWRISGCYLTLSPDLSV